jgi:23S rRNA (adenine2503-C2)-methyltransferase
MSKVLREVAIWSTVRVLSDPVGHVAKYVFETDSAVAEAVLYRYPDYRTRTVICCSTQSGCPVGCRFCGAGDFFVRSLHADEIVAQAVRCLADVDCEPAEMGRLQIMFMSMGEPMLNQSALIAAIAELHARYPNAALLVSTSAPRVSYDGIIAISTQIPSVGLQFSVHESTDAGRNALVPFAAKLTLTEIAKVGERWGAAAGRRPFFNYCAHDANSSEADADRLVALFDPSRWCATVSVICERSDGLPTSNDHQRSLATDFSSLLAVRGYDVRTFDPAGQDTIGGGCGQLHFVQRWASDNPRFARPSAGRGLPVVHVPGAPASLVSILGE